MKSNGEDSTQVWDTTPFDSVEHTFSELSKLKGKAWLCRGQGRNWRLQPLIDRKKLESVTRGDKLDLERQSIDLFRSTARYLHSGEHESLSSEVVAMMLLRHHEVPTRLLDWSRSPYVAAYFAAEQENEKDGEIWAFDMTRYTVQGRKQWKKWPQTTKDGSGDHKQFAAELTAFSVDEPPNWFICAFYPAGFPRQNAQDGAYTMTARFNRNHDDAIAELLNNRECHHKYTLSAKLKFEVRKRLRDQHGIWRGALYPDTAGAAKTARLVFSDYESSN